MTTRQSITRRKQEKEAEEDSVEGARAPGGEAEISSKRKRSKAFSPGATS